MKQHPFILLLLTALLFLHCIKEEIQSEAENQGIDTNSQNGIEPATQLCKEMIGVVSNQEIQYFSGEVFDGKSSIEAISKSQQRAYANLIQQIFFLELKSGSLIQEFSIRNNDNESYNRRSSLLMEVSSAGVIRGVRRECQKSALLNTGNWKAETYLSIESESMKLQNWLLEAGSYYMQKGELQAADDMFSTAVVNESPPGKAHLKYIKFALASNSSQTWSRAISYANLLNSQPYYKNEVQPLVKEIESLIKQKYQSMQDKEQFDHQVQLNYKVKAGKKCNAKQGIINGNFLQSGSRVQSGDYIRWEIQSNQQVYVYIFNIDSAYTINVLFPNVDAQPNQKFPENPLHSKNLIKSNCLQYDTNVGIETMMILADTKPIPKAEAWVEKLRPLEVRKNSNRADVEQLLKEINVIKTQPSSDSIISGNLKSDINYIQELLMGDTGIHVWGLKAPYRKVLNFLHVD